MKLCFKKSATSFVDWAIRLRTFSNHVHVEMLFNNGITWRIELADKPAVHYVEGVTYDPEHWDTISMSVDENKILAWTDTQNGKAYDVIGILNFVFPFGEDDDDDLFCSEGCVYALQQVGLLMGVKAKLVSPGALYRMLA